MSVLLTEKLVKQSNVVDSKSGQAGSVALLEMRTELEMQISKSSKRKSLGLASRLKKSIREYCSVALGALALELVILFSFSSTDGLFLIVPTLAVGTLVYILDGKKRL
jgi:hypothetical protein